MMVSFRKRFIIASFIIFILVSLDQFSKAFLIEFLEAQPGYVFYINSFLDIVHTWNYGISFGLFSEYQKYSNVIFLISNSLIILYLIVTYVLDEKSSKLYLLIISGGLGNLLDRIFRGAVFDFIHVHYQNYHFPVFNIADMLISIGICLFILEVFLKSSPKKSIST